MPRRSTASAAPSTSVAASRCEIHKSATTLTFSALPAAPLPGSRRRAPERDDAGKERGEGDRKQNDG